MKKRKKKKIKLKSLLVTLIIVIFIGIILYGYTKIRITNIYVLGNNILKEQEIIDEAKLGDYPYIHLVSKEKIEQELKKNDVIKNVKVSKSLLGKIVINIEENKVLYKEDNNYMLSNGKLTTFDKEVLNVPELINKVDDEILDKFIKKMSEINLDILERISEIEYQPSNLDNERFLLYMNDGNYVYITLSKISLVNSYNEIYKTLGNNKGILYLDSGNHFEIKKSS